MAKPLADLESYSIEVIGIKKKIRIRNMKHAALNHNLNRNPIPNLL